MPAPTIERTDNDRAYFTDSNGVCWRVHDCCFGHPLAKGGHRKRLALEAPVANTRYFVNEAGDRRAYSFTRGESRRLTLDDCARQFAEAGYCWNGPRNPPPKRPTG